MKMNEKIVDMKIQLAYRLGDFEYHQDTPEYRKFMQIANKYKAVALKNCQAENAVYGNLSSGWGGNLSKEIDILGKGGKPNLDAAKRSNDKLGVDLKDLNFYMKEEAKYAKMMSDYAASMSW